MGPVRQNPIQRTVRAAHLSVLMTVHSFSTQYNTEQIWWSPSYLQANIIAQMMSIGEDEGYDHKVMGSRLYWAHGIKTLGVFSTPVTKQYKLVVA